MRASEKVESKPYAVKWRSDHCQSPPPQTGTGTGNWNASNAMQIMSFRFSIKMLNYYFALRYQSRPAVDSCAANKQSVGQTLVNRQPGPTHVRTCHYGFDLLFVVLRYQFIYYFYRATSSSLPGCGPRPMEKNNMI